MRPEATIVVGVDGSPPSQDALDWAVAEASAMRLPLRIVHGFIWPLMRGRLVPDLIGPVDDGLQAAAERILADAEARAHSAAPDVKITGELVVGAPTSALLRQAHDAELIVIGNRGLGGFTGLLVGSVGVNLAAHATCPVVVVRSRHHDHQPPSPPRVVVGTDGSEVSESAVKFAFQSAARHGTGLTVIRTWTAPMATYPALLVSLDRSGAAERQQLLDALEVHHRTFPTVEVEAKLVHSDHPGRTLVEESATADLVVVGSRGRGGFAGLLLGSVSQSVLEHAKCPVAIVRPHATEYGHR